MRIKIPTTDTITIRLPGKLKLLLIERANKRKLLLNDYVKNALIKYTEFKDDTNTEQ